MSYESVINTNEVISEFNQSVKEFNKQIKSLKEQYDLEYKKIVNAEKQVLFDIVTKNFGDLGKVTKYRNTVRLTFNKENRTKFRSSSQFSKLINEEVGTSFVKSDGGRNAYTEFQYISFELTASYLKTKYNFPSWSVVTRKLKEIQI